MKPLDDVTGKKRLFSLDWKERRFAYCIRTHMADGIFRPIIKGFQGYTFWRNILCIYHLTASCETPLT